MCESLNMWDFIGWRYVWFDEISYLWEDEE